MVDQYDHCYKNGYLKIQKFRINIIRIDDKDDQNGDHDYQMG